MLAITINSSFLSEIHRICADYEYLTFGGGDFTIYLYIYTQNILNVLINK